MKIKSINIKSTKIVLPYDGEVIIDENGIVEVSEKCAEIMVNKTPFWKIVDGEKNDDSETVTDNERDEFEKKIRLMKFDELKSFAIESGCNEDEVNGVTSKKNLVNYLLEKFDSEQ